MKFRKELIDFAGKAQSYCDWIESGLSEPVEELQKAEKHLAELYLAILSLPDATAIWEEVEDLEDAEKDTESEKVLWQKCSEKLENLPVNGYWFIFDASNLEDKDPVFALISDDLSDIYADLKSGLAFYEQEKFAEAFWEWRFNFQVHWGNHLVGAQKTIRNYFSFR